MISHGEAAVGVYSCQRSNLYRFNPTSCGPVDREWIKTNSYRDLAPSLPPPLRVRRHVDKLECSDVSADFCKPTGHRVVTFRMRSGKTIEGPSLSSRYTGMNIIKNTQKALKILSWSDRKCCKTSSDNFSGPGTWYKTEKDRIEIR